MTSAPSEEEQAVTNPYSTSREAQSRAGHGGVPRPLLWVLLVISAACNVVASSMDINPLIGVGFGLLTLSLGAVLVRDHYRNRRR